MQSAMDELASGVLNNAGAICQTYRMLNVPKLLTAIGRSELNVLAVGRGQSWIINARTPDTHHFIGTRINYGYDPTLWYRKNWQRLEE